MRGGLRLVGNIACKIVLQYVLCRCEVVSSSAAQSRCVSTMGVWGRDVAREEAITATAVILCVSLSYYATKGNSRSAMT